ncbi:hypothetical protein IT412_00140 [Candidatus Peregrinibacteria bacterium]|nr:hypothetical protein [Candidatus Peregrinibacteria bacterium]
MSQSSKIALIKEILESAEASLRSAKQMLNELIGPNASNSAGKMAEKVGSIKSTGEGHIIEGAFDGQNMIGPDGKVYSVPANYASKSKLVPGDILKLTITDDGSFVYKQIGPVERKKIVGTLTYDDGQYRVVASAKSYKVLLASVTYFKAEIGDKVTIIVPETEDTDWAAIENVLPRFDESISPDDFKI